MGKRDSEYRAVYERAREAGLEAGRQHTPTPMLVTQHTNPLDDTSPIETMYPPVMGGICGTAYLAVRPGNSGFARFLKREHRAFARYYGGVMMSINDYGQSFECAMAHASAMARVINDSGVLGTGFAFTDDWVN